MTKNGKSKLLIWIILILSYLLMGCNLLGDNKGIDTIASGNGSQTLSVHFIDVGQADSILIEDGNNAMLIDAGNNADGELVTNYLKEQGIIKLNYIIGTHPHEDHIGGMDDVIKEIKVGKLFLTDYVEPSKSFEQLLLAIKEKGLTVVNPAVGDVYALGEASFTFIAPIKKDYGDKVNNYSLGIKLQYGKNTFILTGDAQIESEEDMVLSGIDLNADVLKINHHGSTTSSSEAFIEAVDPAYAVISAGRDNPYGHPSSSVVTRLLDEDIQIYRTDKQGTIIVSSDGQNISFKTPDNKSDIKDELNKEDTEKEAEVLNETSKEEEVIGETTKDEQIKDENMEKEDTYVYITNTGTKYHRGDCQYLEKSKQEISLEEAIAKEYEPCTKCNPPK